MFAPQLIAAVPASTASAILLPVTDHLPLLGGFMAVVIGLLVADLTLFHRNPKPVGWLAAAGGVAFWVVLALLFNAGLFVFIDGWLRAHPQPLLNAGLLTADAMASPSDVALAASNAAFDLSVQWLASYVIEMSLSVDNLFVFVVVLRYFAVPAALQHRVLFWGILGAIIMRAVFIGAGVAVMHRFEWVAGVFGAFLLFTGLKMLAPSRGDGHMVDPGRTVGFRLMKLILPLHREFDGTHFFSKANGRIVATPLLGALVVIEFSDVVFAVDSVPAVLAITREPLLAFTSNIAAVLGLRAMYFLLANAVDRFHLLKPALGLVLSFVGVKMGWQWWYHEPLLPIGISLSVICGVIGASIALSLLFPKKPHAA
jgi:tellurite resistance protein TerC